MKLIIQIPCYNEEKTLPQTLKELPKEIPGIQTIEVLIIDDGSTDRTAEVAKKNGANHILSLSKNQGLAKAFNLGLQESLRLGADIIVNTDADNQYPARFIPDLIKPIQNHEAMMTIGDRQVMRIKDFSLAKKILQKFGSWIVKTVSHSEVTDVTSGFRAFHRDMALRINIHSFFSYTLETIIQAGLSNTPVVNVPIQTNPKTRPSRLFRGNFSYIRSSIHIIFRTYVMYRPLQSFLFLGTVLFSIGSIYVSRFLYAYFFTQNTGGKIQSLILASVFILSGVQCFILGVLADVVAANRRLIEENLYQSKKAALHLTKNQTKSDN